MSPSDSLTRTWKITLLSPLHLGDGNKLLVNLDFLVQNGRVEIIDFDDLTEQLADIPKAIHDLSKNIQLDRILKEYNIAARPLYSMKCGGLSKPKEIRSFLKNAHGEPYLAGSSLKGAIHTALWTALDMSNIPSPRTSNKNDYRSGFKRSVEKLGGENPYQMFIRPLQISDSTALNPQGSLICEEIKFFNLQYNNQPGWKDFSSKHTVPDFRQATGMHAETLRQGVTLVAQAHIDLLLAKDSVRHAANIKRSEHVSDFDRMIQRIREYTKHIAERERDYFDRYGAATQDVVRFYDRLLQQMNQIIHQPGVFILRIAWGSGWRGMTGDWIDDKDMAFIREKEYEKLGKPGVAVFPKTRRLAIDPATGTPALPLGWVLVEPADSGAFRLKQHSSKATSVKVDLQATQSTTRTPSPTQPEPAAAIDPETLRKEKISRFEQRVKAVKTFQSEAVQLIQSVQKEEDSEIKRHMVAMLLEKAKSLPNKAYTNALKQNKPRATQLQQLADTTP